MIKTSAQAMLSVNEKLKIQKNSIKNGNSKKRKIGRASCRERV